MRPLLGEEEARGRGRGGRAPAGWPRDRGWPSSSGRSRRAVGAGARRRGQLLHHRAAPGAGRRRRRPGRRGGRAVAVVHRHRQRGPLRRRDAGLRRRRPGHRQPHRGDASTRSCTAAHPRGHRGAPGRRAGRPRRAARRCATRWGVALVEDAACAAGSTVPRPAGRRRRRDRRLVVPPAQGHHHRRGRHGHHRRRRVGGAAAPAARARHERVAPPTGTPATQPVLEAYLETGFNYRMTDIQAAVGLVQLGRLDEIVARRRELAARYHELLADVAGPARRSRDPAYGHDQLPVVLGAAGRRLPGRPRRGAGRARRGRASRPGAASWPRTWSRRTPASARRAAAGDRAADPRLADPAAVPRDDARPSRTGWWPPSTPPPSGATARCRRLVGEPRMTAPIPLVDLAWQHREVADEVVPGIAAVLAECRVRRRQGGPGLRGAVRRGPRGPALRRRRQRHRRARTGAAGSGRRAGRRGRAARPTRSSRPPRRSCAAGARPVLADVDAEHLLLDRRRGRARHRPADACGRARASLRPGGARSSRSREVRAGRRRGRGRRAGAGRDAARPPGRRSRARGRHQLLPGQEPRRVRGRRRGPTDDADVAAAGPADGQPRQHRALPARGRGGQLPPRHGAGRRAAGQAGPPGRLERGPAGGGRPLRRSC